jgi:hypothetical protein
MVSWRNCGDIFSRAQQLGSALGSLAQSAWVLEVREYHCLRTERRASDCHRVLSDVGQTGELSAFLSLTDQVDDLFRDAAARFGENRDTLWFDLVRQRLPKTSAIQNACVVVDDETKVGVYRITNALDVYKESIELLDELMQQSLCD